MEYSINLTLDQIEALVLACGIAAKYSTAGNCERILEVRRRLIHAQVMAQNIGGGGRFMWEFLAKFYNYAGAEVVRKIDIDLCGVPTFPESERVLAWKMALDRAFYLCNNDKDLEGFTVDTLEFLAN